MGGSSIEVVQAGPDRVSALAAVFGWAFVTEPMMLWPMGDGADLAERFTTVFSDPWNQPRIAAMAEDGGRRWRSLIEAGLTWARTDGVGAFLSTGTSRNVAIYGRSGFRVVEDLDAPGGGPHIWFMRWDP